MTQFGLGIVSGLLLSVVVRDLGTQWVRWQGRRQNQLRYVQGAEKVRLAADILAWQVCDMFGVVVSDQQHAHVSAQLQAIIREQYLEGVDIPAIEVSEARIREIVAEVRA